MPVSNAIPQEIPSYNTQRGTLQNLSAYLTLSRAKSSGFSPEAYGLSEADAGEIAYVFSLYDLNDDARLELSELKKLWQVWEGAYLRFCMHVGL